MLKNGEVRFEEGQAPDPELWTPRMIDQAISVLRYEYEREHPPERRPVIR
jgi:hypothetical protein